MKTLTLALDDRAWGALLLVAPDLTPQGMAAFAREALGRHVDCMMEGTKEDEIAALFQEEPDAEEAPAPTRTVAVELSPSGASLLAMVMAHDEHASEADAFRAMLANVGGGLCEYLGNMADKGNLVELLKPDKDEREEENDEAATSAAANRDDLPLAAAAKPPKPQP